MTMTLNEINTALLKIPATPVSDADIEARASLARQRGEIIEAERAKAAAPKPIAGAVAVAVPDELGGIISYSTGRFLHAEIVDGRRVIRMPIVDFHKLMTSGKNGGGINLPAVIGQLNAQLVSSLGEFRL
jgi:hypothetical protein